MNDQIPDFDVQWRGGPLSAVRIKLIDGSQLTLGEAVRDALKLRTIKAPSAIDGKLIASQLVPKSLDATLSRQLDTIRDQLARIEELEQLNVIAHDVQCERETDMARLYDQVELLRSKLADAIGENTQLDESLADIRKLAEVNGMNVNVLSERLAETESESTEVIRKCNEQLAALAAAAKLRDQQVETLARLWLSAFEETGSPVGAMITRQLYRVMADHGIDVSSMPVLPPIDIADCA